MIFCRSCGITEQEIGPKELHLHHLIPKSLGGTDKDGRRYFCKKCHDILHNYLPMIIWKYMEEEQKQKAREEIKRFSECFRFFKDGSKTI
tara:strand:+ start:4143 stop:4412 length:270 start_codon:yes stop_codon:yes gene_type:complete